MQIKRIRLAIYQEDINKMIEEEMEVLKNEIRNNL